MVGRSYNSFSFSSKELFDNFNVKQLKIKAKTLEKEYGSNKRKVYCGLVFTYCIYLICLDIIQNNVTFALPTKAFRKAQIYVKPFVGEELQLYCKRGRFKDIDLLATNFVAYDLVLEWYGGGRTKWKTIHLTKPYKKMFIDNVNAGKTYY